MESLDIRAKAPFPGGALSNFAPNAFALDSVACASMEGFLQSLKIADPAEQRHVCTLVGPEAQSVGQRYAWGTTRTLWWRGEPIDRLSDAYQTLLDRAYQALFEQSKNFRDALEASGSARLTHTLGRSDPCETILTTEKFCSGLNGCAKPDNCDA
jgi:hypothetical protein